MRVLALVFRERLRARYWALDGVEVEQKVRIGPSCQYQGPGQIRLRAECHLERNIFIKVVSEDASLDVGRRVFVGNGAEFDLALPCRVGEGTLIAPGVFITDHHHRIVGTAPVAESGTDAAVVCIGAEVWLGANVVVLKSVTIGRGAVVGAGAVVTRDVAPYEIVAGVPAKRIGMRRA